MSSLADPQSIELHMMFQQLINALGLLPTNCLSGDAQPPAYDLRDDSTALLREMDRVLGTSSNTDTSDSPNTSDCEGEEKVRMRAVRELN